MSSRRQHGSTGAVGVCRTAIALSVATVAAAGGAAWAGGSNYGIAPGARPAVEGKITEWPVPTPEFARDPAPGPDGNIYVAVTATGRVIEHKAPSGGDPHTLVIDEQGIIWFTVQNGQRVGRLDTRTGKMTEFKTRGNPYGIALDRNGHVWFCQFAGDRLGRIDATTQALTEMTLEPGSRPRRMAAAPDGSLWVTYYGNGKLVKVDPIARKVVQEYALRAGPGGGPYAVTVDGAGVVWANEIKTDTVARLDPTTGQVRVFPLPSKNVGIRKMIVDADGRLWYMGSHNGRLGVIE